MSSSRYAPRPPIRSTYNSPPTPSFANESDQEMEIRSDFSKVIKNARESIGLSQEEVGRKINEKPSVISHLEVGSMKPSDALAKKLEHFLKVELFVPVDDSEESQSSS